MSLERFKTAQEGSFSGIDTALTELRAGRKTSHWIWYVFPQLAGLGRSGTAQKYALRDRDEAVEYLREPVLRERLIRATALVARHVAAGAALPDLMGGELDAMKLVSSLTLFELAARELAAHEPTPQLNELLELCRVVLAAADAQGFGRCAFTLAHVER